MAGQAPRHLSWRMGVTKGPHRLRVAIDADAILFGKAQPRLPAISVDRVTGAAFVGPPALAVSEGKRKRTGFTPMTAGTELAGGREKERTGSRSAVARDVEVETSHAVPRVCGTCQWKRAGCGVAGQTCLRVRPDGDVSLAGVLQMGFGRTVGVDARSLERVRSVRSHVATVCGTGKRTDLLFVAPCAVHARGLLRLALGLLDRRKIGRKRDETEK